MIELLRAKAQMHPDLEVITGLGLGAEMLGAEAAAAAAVPYRVILAFDGMEERLTPLKNVSTNCYPPLCR